MNVHVLSEDQVEFYRGNDYLHAQGVLPGDLLQLGRKILARWADDQIAKWFEEGRLTETLHTIDFEHRLVQAWNQAGRPRDYGSPRRDLLSPYMYEFVTHPSLLDVASDLLGTEEVSVHGIFNARPKLPDQSWSTTPWHQDGQYYRDSAGAEVISMWIPMQPVNKHSSCLQVAPGTFGRELREAVMDDVYRNIGLSEADYESLQPITVEMETGDVLCFNQFVPHRALPNTSDAVRWSLDVRYEPTDRATETGKKQGFRARSRDPRNVVNYRQWLRQWEGIPPGAY